MFQLIIIAILKENIYTKHDLMLNHFIIEYACYIMQYNIKWLKYQYLVLVTKIALNLYSTGISLYTYAHTHLCIQTYKSI